MKFDPTNIFIVFPIYFLTKFVGQIIIGCIQGTCFTYLHFMSFLAIYAGTDKRVKCEQVGKKKAL